MKTLQVGKIERCFPVRGGSTKLYSPRKGSTPLGIAVEVPYALEQRHQIPIEPVRRFHLCSGEGQ